MFGRKKRDRRRHPFLSAAFRHLKLLLLILLTYLVHVCVMPDVNILGASPKLIFAVTAIITVAFDRWRSAWTGMIFGILLEVMQPTRTLFNLLLYPILAIFGALVFADKSMQQLEYERGVGKPGRNASPWLRTPLCAAADTLMFEIVNIVYAYLRGGVLPAVFIWRGIGDVLLTVLLTLLLMLPIRRFFGIRPAADPGANLKPIPYGRS